MDKETVTLKYQKNRVETLSEQTKTNLDDTKKTASLIHDLDLEIGDLMNELGITDTDLVSKSDVQCGESEFGITPSIDEYDSFDDLFNEALLTLEESSVNCDVLTYIDLIDEASLDEIDIELNRPLARQDKWTKNDKIIVFVASIVGMVGDLVLGNRDNKLTGTNSKLSEWLDQFHKHNGGSPLDYQGPGFGGGDHRVLSKGHDLFRMVSAIRQIMNGQFEGVTYRDGVAYKVFSEVNQNGTPYEQMELFEAIANYFSHMKGDFFSKKSLPVPGYSFLMEADNRQLRIFAATMYKQGFNLKNVALQGITTLSIELILRIYFAVVEVQKIMEEELDIEIDSDYSNIDKIKRVTLPASNPKYREMLLMTHALVTAFNIGKITIKKAPWEINLTEILATIRYLVPYIRETMFRYSDVAKITRNTEDINQIWIDLNKSVEISKNQLLLPDSVLVIE